MSGSYTAASSVQVLDFEEIGLLIRCGCLYELSVRQTSGLPSASFRFHLTVDTLAVWLTIPPAGVVRGLAPLKQVRPAGRTTKKNSLARGKGVPRKASSKNKYSLKSTREYGHSFIDIKLCL